MGNPTLYSGFTPIPVTYATSSIHYIYARSHVGSKKSNDGLPTGRTLFLVNIPPDATDRDVIQLFKSAGTVEKVVFGTGHSEETGNDSDDKEEDEMEVEEVAEGEKPRKRRKVVKEAIPKVTSLPAVSLRTLRKTGGSAYVLFLDSSSHDRAVTSLSKSRPWPESKESSGLEHYMALYNSLRPPLDIVQEHADTYIEVYEYELAKAKQNPQYRKGEAIVDEDGFTLVTRGGAYGQTLGGGVVVASKKFQATGETSASVHKKEKKEQEGFYGFQKAEKQRKELLDLKRRWEQDRAKVEKLKASRRFNPY